MERGAVPGTSTARHGSSQVYTGAALRQRDWNFDGQLMMRPRLKGSTVTSAFCLGVSSCRPTRRPSQSPACLSPPEALFYK